MRTDLQLNTVNGVRYTDIYKQHLSSPTPADPRITLYTISCRPNEFAIIIYFLRVGTGTAQQHAAGH